MKKGIRDGFTLVEILIVIAILGILSAISILTFRALYTNATLRAATQEVYLMLEDARSRTLASEDAFTYGVHIASSSVTRFRGSVYVAGDANNVVYVFEGGVTATGTIVASGSSIVFERLTGDAAGNGRIYLRDRDGTATNTIEVQASGLIEYE